MNLDTFHFLRPWWLLGLIPMGWLFWRCLHLSQAGGSWRQVCDPHLLPHLLIGRDQAGGKGPCLLLGLGWALALLALAGPVWSKLPQPVVRSQSALVVVLDLSRSMDAQDVRPSRLTRAKHKVLDLLKRRAEGQTGLVVFAQEPFVVSPLTDDAKTIASMVPALSTDLMPVQGSRPEQALEQADRLLEHSQIGKGEILLITDGGEGGAVRDTIDSLREKGRVVSILAVGTEDGAPIPLHSGGFLKDASGAIVIPKLDGNALQTLAQSGGGRFVTLQTDDHDLDLLFEPRTHHPSFRESEESDRTTDRWREEGPWLVLAVLIVGFPAFRKGWLGAVLILGLLGPFPAHAWTWEELWSRPDQQGSRKLAQGNPQEAAELFSDESWRGVAQYRSGQYEKAAEAFAHQTGPEDRYNQGNALARLGKFKEALEAYEETLTGNPDHEDARHNAEVIRKLLEKQDQPSKNGSGVEEKSPQSSPPSSQGSESQNGQDQESRGSQARADRSPTRRDMPEETAHHSESSSWEDRQTPQGGKSQEPERGPHNPARDDQSQRSTPNPRTTSPEIPPHEGEPSKVAQASSETEGDQEERQAMEQWLRRIPDDPGGLLRRKFMLEHQRRGNVSQDVGQSW